MQEKSNAPLQVAVHGMDGRSQKMMVMFLQGPCKGYAVVVTDEDAEVDILDGDGNSAKALLEKRKNLNPDRPLIVLSLQQLNLDGVIFVQKPVQTKKMLEALKTASKIITKSKKQVTGLKQDANRPNKTKEQTKPATPKPEMITRVRESKPEKKQEAEKKVYLNTDEQKKTTKHQTAMHIDEKNFSSFIGLASGIDFNDLRQLKSASYNAKQYYQGYLQSAYKLAVSKKRSVQLNSAWKPLSIFPSSHEIWVDADDKQLRAFASVPIATNSGGQNITVTPINPSKVSANRDLKKFQSVEAFLWKLAIWTSKGRYPQGIDIDRPVYLKRWPNFTRLMIVPHALRITALLMEGPRTLINIAQVLNIKPQYVFAFFSAAYAIGLAGQSVRKADEMVAPDKPKASKKKGLLNNIMRKLRGKK